MRSRQHADFNRDVPHVLEAAAVDTDSLFDDALAHAVLDRLVVNLADDVAVLGEPLAELGDGPDAQLVDAALAGRLVRAVENRVETEREVLADDLDHLGGIRR